MTFAQIAICLMISFVRVNLLKSNNGQGVKKVTNQSNHKNLPKQ